jgi:DNA-binding GntR family transcriptional regulator
MTETQKRKLSTGLSLADQAYAALRADITDGRFSPGQRVTERALASQLGISPTPVREAIARLEHERLFEREGRALSVAAPSISRLRQLVRIQAVLRGLAARFACIHASDGDIAAIGRLHERARLVKRTDRAVEDVASEVLDLTRRFHAKIDEAAQNPMLVDMIATATAFDWAFRLEAASQLGPLYPVEPALREHDEIVSALRARDEARAEQLMVAHTLRAGEELLAIAASGHEAEARAGAQNA